MTVADLIAEMQKLPPHQPVYVEGYEITDDGPVMDNAPLRFIEHVQGVLGYGPLLVGNS